MAYFYRGILYLGDDDYDNARAAFKAAEFQDTVAEDEEFSGDFALMNLLSGWATRCDGDPNQAEDYFSAAIG